MKFKPLGYAFLVIIIVLLITKPSLNDFKNFTSSYEYDNLIAERDIKRTKSFDGLLFAIYDLNIYGRDTLDRPWPKNKKKYVGIFKNFFLLQ